MLFIRFSTCSLSYPLTQRCVRNQAGRYGRETHNPCIRSTKPLLARSRRKADLVAFSKAMWKGRRGGACPTSVTFIQLALWFWVILMCSLLNAHSAGQEKHGLLAVMSQVFVVASVQLQRMPLRDTMSESLLALLSSERHSCLLHVVLFRF